MNTKALRQKVLDLAIHGKLVPQNPNDESATVLLEKIRAEKAEKIKKGELKADKKDSFIFVGSDKRHYEQFADGTVKDIEDEIPFEVPEGWAWERISNIITYIGDGDWIESKDQSESGIRLIQTGNIGFGKFKDKEGKYHFISEDTFHKLGCNEIFEGDILLSRLPDPVGRACILPKLSERTITAVDCTIIRLNEKLFLKELFVYYTTSNKYLELIKDNCTGTTRLRISRANLEKIFVPIPPIKEQKRLLNEIDKIFLRIDLLDYEKNDLKPFISNAKSKILDLAIHGKLVSQDPNDEPAEELLKRIATSDNRPYEKVDKEPFEIPDSWKWVKLNDLAEIARGGSPRPIQDYITDNQDGINWIKIGDTSEKSKYITSSKEKIKPEGKKHSRYVHAGDFLLTNSMSFGRPYILKIDGCIHDGWLVFANIKECLLQDYLYYALSSAYIYETFSNVAAGSTVKNLKSDTVKQVDFPLPPLSEQKRIVEAIENMYEVLDQIQNNLV